MLNREQILRAAGDDRYAYRAASTAPATLVLAVSRSTLNNLGCAIFMAQDTKNTDWRQAIGGEKLSVWITESWNRNAGAFRLSMEALGDFYRGNPSMDQGLQILAGRGFGVHENCWRESVDAGVFMDRKAAALAMGHPGWALSVEAQPLAMAFFDATKGCQTVQDAQGAIAAVLKRDALSRRGRWGAMKAAEKKAASKVKAA